jgi:uncharacterized membrane protein
VKLYIGSEYIFLNPGVYTYTIHYLTDNQLSFYNDYDELYWNINGNYWDFQIDSLSATIHLPDSAEVVQYHAYTGFYGESSSNYEAKFINNNQVFIKATTPFALRKE